MHKCCNAVEVAAEACNGGTASCQEKAECSLCSEEYGALGEHAYAWDYSGSEYDVYKCTTADCEHEDADKKFKKVVSKTQYIVKDSATASISLEGVGTYSSVVSVKLGDVSLGTNLSSLDLSGVTQEIGDKSLSIVVKDADNAEHTVTAPVAFITGYINSEDDFLTKVRASAAATSGYYVLSKNLDISTKTLTQAWNWNTFSGTFDGNGYTIKSKHVLGGLFQVLDHATVRNLTVQNAWISNDANSSLLGRNITDSTLENVTIQVVGGPNNYQGVSGDNVGLLAATRCSGNTFKNLQIEASNWALGSIFGGVSAHGFGANTFSGCVLKCASFVELGHGSAQFNGTTDPIMSVTGLTINPAQDAE